MVWTRAPGSMPTLLLLLTVLASEPLCLFQAMEPWVEYCRSISGSTWTGLDYRTAMNSAAA